MITRTFTCILCVSLFAAWQCVQAATEQWRSDGQKAVRQIVADGKGGCAYVREDTNSVVSLVWLDKKGAIIYSTILSNVIGNQILACTPKQLVYADERPDGIVIQVDQDGQETVLSTPNGHVGSGFLDVIPRSATTDKKGFFGVLFKYPASDQDVLRFKNK